MTRLFDMVMAEAITEEKYQVDNDKLSAKVNALSEENQLLKTENYVLKTKIENIRKTVKELTAELGNLTDLIQDKDNTIAKLQKQISELHSESSVDSEEKDEKKHPIDDLIITGDPGKDLDALDKYYIALGFQHPLSMETRGKIFLMAIDEGLITEEEYQAARSMYNTLWNYSRD